MKQKLFNYLNQNGYGYEVNDDVIKFNVNELHFFCQFFPKDPYFFRIILPCEDNVQDSSVNSLIAEINSRYKVAKIIEVNNKPWIVGESFAYSNQNGEMLIDRIVRLLIEVFNAYSNERNKQIRKEGEEVDG